MNLKNIFKNLKKVKVNPGVRLYPHGEKKNDCGCNTGKCGCNCHTNKDSKPKRLKISIK